jgi:hypothetical protein
VLLIARLLADVDYSLGDLGVVDVPECQLLGNLLRQEYLLQLEDFIKYTHCPFYYKIIIARIAINPRPNPIAVWMWIRLVIAEWIASWIAICG